MTEATFRIAGNPAQCAFCTAFFRNNLFASTRVHLLACLLKMLFATLLEHLQATLDEEEAGWCQLIVTRRQQDKVGI